MALRQSWSFMQHKFSEKATTDRKEHLVNDDERKVEGRW